MKTILLAEDIYQQVKQWIVTFELQPGAPLQEADLADRFQVSRTPVREALRILKSEGLVEIVPGRGARVTHVSVRDLVDAFEAREWLEPMAAAKAARTMDVDTLARLETVASSIPEELDSRESVALFERADMEIHDLILRAAGNRIVRALATEARVTTRRAEYMVPPARHLRGREEHLAIVEAIKSRDATAAEQRMREHIISARERLLRGFRSPADL